MVIKDSQTMKKLLFVLFATTLLAGCNREFSSKDFTHTGCNKATETKADAGEEVSRYMFMPVADYLILKYEGGDLRVIRRNLHASCGVKTEDGLICEVSLEGNTVHYLVYETHSANCPCDVNEMTSAVTGLQVGKQYIFQLNKYKPLSFTFTKDLFLVQDELSLME